jgi:large subunit ribosomal protein L10
MSTEYVTKVHQHKTDAVEAVKSRFESASNYVFANYRGLTVDQITELRNQLREKNAEFRVIKNRYAKIALEQLEKPDVSDFLIGPTAVALMEDDFSPVVKALLDYGKEHSVEVKGAIIDGTVFDSVQAEKLSKLPSRDELLAKLMGTMNAPLQHFLYALNGVPTKLVRALKAIQEKKEEEG